MSGSQEEQTTFKIYHQNDAKIIKICKATFSKYFLNPILGKYISIGVRYKKKFYVN